ncbi:retrovirus-related pol polyprotein from transposon TNT 1-94 [Tanacetum coccineum]
MTTRSKAGIVKTRHPFNMLAMSSTNLLVSLLAAKEPKDGLFLSQSKYAHDILSCAGLLDSKPAGTPLATNDIFTTGGRPFHDPTLYRSFVGALIMRYVKGTLTHGMHFSCPKKSMLIGYSDSDWARCIETRRLTYGYSIFFGGNLVSWSAKK